MLGRQMIGYVPSLVVPGIVSFASLYCFTNLLNPDSYGHYVLAINLMSMLVGVAFYWLQSAASRLLPQAVEQGTEERLTATLYTLQAVSSVGLLIVAGIVIAVFPLGDWRVAAWFAPPLAVFRSLLNLNQSYHRNFLRIGRYNIIEVGQAVTGLALAIILISPAVCMNASGAAIGTLAGLVLMAVYDWRMLVAVRWRSLDRGMFREIALFGLPFVINYGLSFVLSRSDSFLIQYYRGSAEVGLYNAGYAFPDRIGQYLFMAVATASFPLTVRLLEKHGREAARAQTYINGIAVLSLALPACVGLLFANHAIVATMIGEEFREGAARIMPWITVSMILNGLAAHYFDHALHLAKRTWLFFVTLGPPAIVNFVGNLWAIPHFGYMGAAYTTLASYALYLALSIYVGGRVFPIKFPWRPAAQIAASTAFMSFVLFLCDFEATVVGLFDLVVVGGSVYALGLWGFDVGGCRSVLLPRMMARFNARGAAVSDWRVEAVKEASAIAALAPEWQALYERSGSPLFGKPSWYGLWFRHLGQRVRPVVITVRDGDGMLRGLMPLALRRSKGLWVAVWAGHEVFDFGDVLADSSSAACAAVNGAQRLAGADILLLKEVREGAISRACLDETFTHLPFRRNYVLTFEQPSGEAWLAAQSRKLRGDIRRKTEKMQAKGPISFHVWRGLGVFPEAAFDALYQQKLAWFKARKESGVFARPEVRDFLRDLACAAADDGEAYLSWMTCGDEFVACHMGFVHGGVLYLYNTTYAADYAAYSPGNSMMAQTIKWAADSGVQLVDFMRGDESYKARFAKNCRTLASYSVGCTMLGRVALALRGIGRKEAATVDKDEAAEE